jgi:hypothetical protein
MEAELRQLVVRARPQRAARALVVAHAGWLDLAITLKKHLIWLKADALGKGSGEPQLMFPLDPEQRPAVGQRARP